MPNLNSTTTDPIHNARVEGWMFFAGMMATVREVSGTREMERHVNHSRHAFVPLLASLREEVRLGNHSLEVALHVHRVEGELACAYYYTTQDGYFSKSIDPAVSPSFVQLLREAGAPGY